MIDTIRIDGYTLSIPQILDFIEDETIRVVLCPEAAASVAHAQREADRWLLEGSKSVYGFHTGLGRLKEWLIDEADQALFQCNILYSHATGVGDYFDDTVSRLTLLLRANTLARGHSGVRVELIERILQFLHFGVYPMMRQIGSLGIGDLQPQAQLGLCLVGLHEGELKYQGDVGPADEILASVGMEPVVFPLARMEALALVTGGTVLLSVSLLAYSRARKLLDLADGAIALNMEALRGDVDAFDARVHAARGIQGQEDSARNVRSLLYGSQLTGLAGRIQFESTPRVQDPVSFRCSPQVHGACRDAWGYVESVLARTLNASTDNPLFFENADGKHESLSGGNFHGAVIGYSMDLACIVMTDLAVLSERRSARLLDPQMSHGLPTNLVADRHGVNTGFALIQANATALVAEMRALSAPSSGSSIPAKNNVEDHNSMGVTAARKCLKILDYLQMTLAVEYLCACQAIDLIHRKVPELALGLGTRKLHDRVRQEIPPMLTDFYAGKLLFTMNDVLAQGDLLRIIEGSSGLVR